MVMTGTHPNTPIGPVDSIPDQTPRDARRTDGEAHGPHGEVAPYSLFRPTQASASGLTLLMLPGTGHTKAHFEASAWIDGFAQAGLAVLTLSYDRRALSSLHDYVRQVFLVLRAAGIRPEQAMPVGHSLGGAVAQAVVSRAALVEAGYGRATFAGVVILAALAPELWLRTYLPLMLPLWLGHPRLAWRIQQDPTSLFSTPALTRKYLFQPATPEAVIAWCRSVLTSESGPAARSLMRAKTAPLAVGRALFIAGARDRIVSPRLVARTAERYQQMGCKAELLLVPGTPHNLMHDGEIMRVIEAIEGFVRACERDSNPIQAAASAPTTHAESTTEQEGLA